jgi:Protein of unknown function (DUF3313)
MATKLSNYKANLVKISSILVCATLLSACASQQTTRTGFLNSYTHMDVSEEDKDALVYKSRTKKAYSHFMVDEVTYSPGQKSEKDLSADQLLELKKSYREAAIKTFSEKYQYTNLPAEGVMRLRLAITGIETPYLVINYLAGPLSNGGASSESEVIDAISGERIVALSTHSNANPINGGVIEYFTKTGHAESVLKIHAEQLRALVDNAQQHNIR